MQVQLLHFLLKQFLAPPPLIFPYMRTDKKINPFTYANKTKIKFTVTLLANAPMALEYLYLKHSNLWKRDKKHSKATKGKQYGRRARWRKQHVVNAECMRGTLLAQLLHPHDPMPSQLLPVSRQCPTLPPETNVAQDTQDHPTSSQEQHWHQARWFVELKKQTKV